MSSNICRDSSDNPSAKKQYCSQTNQYSGYCTAKILVYNFVQLFCHIPITYQIFANNVLYAKLSILVIFVTFIHYLHTRIVTYQPHNNISHSYQAIHQTEKNHLCIFMWLVIFLEILVMFLKHLNITIIIECNVFLTWWHPDKNLE